MTTSERQRRSHLKIRGAVMLVRQCSPDHIAMPRGRRGYLSYGGNEQARRNESVNPCRACGTLSSSRFNRICTYALSAHKSGESFEYVSDAGLPSSTKASNSPATYFEL